MCTIIIDHHYFIHLIVLFYLHTLSSVLPLHHYQDLTSSSFDLRQPSPLFAFARRTLLAKNLCKIPKINATDPLATQWCTNISTAICRDIGAAAIALADAEAYTRGADDVAGALVECSRHYHLRPCAGV